MKNIPIRLVTEEDDATPTTSYEYQLNRVSEAIDEFCMDASNFDDKTKYGFSEHGGRWLVAFLKDAADEFGVTGILQMYTRPRVELAVSIGVTEEYDDENGHYHLENNSNFTYEKVEQAWRAAGHESPCFGEDALTKFKKGIAPHLSNDDVCSVLLQTMTTDKPKLMLM
jgi:hypothetical protein